MLDEFKITVFVLLLSFLLTIMFLIMSIKEKSKKNKIIYGVLFVIFLGGIVLFSVISWNLKFGKWKKD